MVVIRGLGSVPFRLGFGVCGLASVPFRLVVCWLRSVVCRFVIRGLRSLPFRLVVCGLGGGVRGLRSVVCNMFGVDIVMRISIIGDQGTACVVTCELDHVWVDVIERSDDRFTINLNHSLVRVYSGGSELGVDVASSLDVASSNVEGITVAALGLGGLVTVAFMMLDSGELVADGKLGVSAGEDMGAGGDHLVGESELLAVKNESVLVVLKVNL